jgi:acetoin utilization deacetylase AcuC-like enzyme
MLFTDPVFLDHDTGKHVETAQRLRSVTARLQKSELIKMCHEGKFQPLTEETVAKLHTAKQVQQVKQIAEHGGGRLDPDTVVSAKSYQAGLSAAGACVAAVDAVMKGDAINALCLVRPPGHHATPTRSMGFCLFNNVALAARHAKDAHKLTKILIVDWDVHHGNGTQDIFWEDPQVMFVSIHRHGMGFYPGTGDEDETGGGKGLGFTLNVTVKRGAERKEHRERFLKGLEKAADKIKPELVLLSAGFDAHVKDPLGGTSLETEDFATFTKQVLDVAKTHAKSRLVSCLEGGYDLEALAESVQAHLEELLTAKS